MNHTTNRYCFLVSTASAPPLKSKINRDVTQRSRKSLYPMLEVEAAQKLILDFIETNKCGQQKQSLSCRQAGGYIVAETTVAKDDLPPFDASIKDGYAVIASDGAGMTFKSRLYDLLLSAYGF